MKPGTTEADARIEIVDMLRKSQWDPADKSQVLTEYPVKINRGFRDIGEEGSRPRLQRPALRHLRAPHRLHWGDTTSRSPTTPNGSSSTSPARMRETAHFSPVPGRQRSFLMI